MINIILQKIFLNFILFNDDTLKKKNTELSTEENRQTDGKECSFKFTNVKSSYDRLRKD